MIAKKEIQSLRKTIPWQSDAMIAQDMIISRALIDLYNNPIIRENLIFRGGTALNKIFLDPSARYSEDIDFVIVEEKPIGFLLDAIRASLTWLGKPNTTRDKFGFKAKYTFDNTEGGKAKLKIETNSTEVFHFDPLVKVPFSFTSNWFSGTTNIITYCIEELMATKLRAIYQRRKGRDLFDAWYVFSKNLADINKCIKIFHAYNAYNKTRITKKMFLENILEKKQNRDFRQDMSALLPLDMQYSFDQAFDFFLKAIIPKL